MKITIEINTDNAAFAPHEEIEVARILIRLTDKMMDEGRKLGQLDGQALMDINGHRVGSIKVTED